MDLKDFYDDIVRNAVSKIQTVAKKLHPLSANSSKPFENYQIITQGDLLGVVALKKMSFIGLLDQNQ